jgi:hypothetical protein
MLGKELELVAKAITHTVFVQPGDRVLLTLAPDVGWTPEMIHQMDTYLEDAFDDVTFTIINGISGLVIQRGE